MCDQLQLRLIPKIKLMKLTTLTFENHIILKVAEKAFGKNSTSIHVKNLTNKR